MNRSRPRLPLPAMGLIAASLVACGAKPPVAAVASAPALATLPVGSAGVGGGQGWDGVVEAVRQAVISAQTGGRVSRIDVDVNDHVASGAVLLRLTAVEQQAGAEAARAQLKSAEAVLVEAEARYGRASELVVRQLVSRADHDVARAARDSALAARDAARAQLQQAEQQAAYTVVRAPYAGIVSARHVETDEVVAPGRPLFEIYAPGALRIEVQVPQSDAAAIRVAPRAAVLLADGRRIEAGEVTVFPSADPFSHSVTVRVQLPVLNSAPEPGVTAKVMFPTATVEAPLQVPATTVVQRGEVSGVYVVSGADVSLRQLRLGERRGSDVVVLAGLARGERIATDPVAATRWLVEHRQGSGPAHE
jgi:RND family efflux transporter MFP subunit